MQADSQYFRFASLDPVSEQWRAIAQYNVSIRDLLPPGARDFVLSSWHYDYNDPRCPHDSWIVSIDFKFYEAQSKPHSLILRLLGAFHDRHIFLKYEGITELCFDGKLVSSDGRDVEWIYDEVHLLPSGRVEHVIEFARCVVKIECIDFTYGFELLGSS